STSKTYRVFNKITLVIYESMHVIFRVSWNNISNESICIDDLERNFGDLRDKRKEASLNEKKEERCSSLPKV
ncbi:hypothetical protein, partial [Staphylococcus nepalensis]|uniref:hypothetical protein n=1 Tax=Staphylococcus nepalensis TaxID=214473 RepID=UPI00285FFB91